MKPKNGKYTYKTIENYYTVIVFILQWIFLILSPWKAFIRNACWKAIVAQRDYFILFVYNASSDLKLQL